MSKIDVDGLEFKNLLIIYGVSKQIHLELNITKSNYVKLDRYSAPNEFFTAEGVQSLASVRIGEIKDKVINYLKEQGAFKTSSKQTLYYLLDIDRDAFYKLFVLLDTKYKGLTKPKEETKQITQPTTRLVFVYNIEFKDGIIFLNDIYLTKPQYGSINYDFFEYVYKRPNERHNVKELMTQLNHPTKKTVHQIINDLGFKGDLKILFFPKASSKFVEFNNPINAESLKSHHIDYLKAEFGRKTVEKLKKQ